MQQQLAPMVDAENRAKPVNYKSQAGGQRRYDSLFINGPFSSGGYRAREQRLQ
jgi:hypothetical protein